MLSPEDIRFFRENGYLRGPQLLNDEQLDTMRAALDRVLTGASEGAPEYTAGLAAKGPDDTKAVTQTVNAWMADRVFWEHIHNPAVTSACAELIGADSLRLWHDQVLIKPPSGGNVVPWHQDYMYWQMVDRSDMLTCWMPLDDATEENGCMLFVPRSHKWGLFDHIDLGGDFEKLLNDPKLPAGETVELVPMPTKAGHCTFHHSLTFHGTSINRTTRPRRAIIAHFMSGRSRFNAANDHVMRKYVAVADGDEFVEGMFPLVFDAGKPVPASEPALLR